MENADLKSQLKERDARIAKLESVLEESRRAGKRQAAPFSKDKPKRDPKKPGRKPGSKYGRQAVRAIPVPDKTFEAPCPEQCPCGGKVGAEGSIDLYQVDIPPIQPETWKFVVGHGHCQECGRRVRGQHPLLISKAFEVGTVHFGPRLLAFAAFQKMICGVSYDKIRLGFEQMLGFPVARSTLCRAMQRLARRAKPTRDALVEALRASPVVYADETGWKQGGRRVWLWVFTNLRETVYEILPGRGFEQAASVLGKNYAGTLGVDGWAPYRCFKEATLQTCYNHLLHRCHELLETATRGAVRFPRLVKAILRHALALRDRRDAGEISPHGLRVAKGLLQAKMNRLLHGRFTNPANQRFAKHLRRYRDNLFVFLDRADVEATNYPAEQDIRIAVVNRKTCGGGNRTAKGAQAQSILMSVLQSCRHKGIRVIDIVTSILRAPDNTPHPLGQPRAVNNYDVLLTTLVLNKQTFVHARFWRDLLSVAMARDRWQMDGLSKDDRTLLQRVESQGQIRASRTKTELPSRLLVHAKNIHTETGAHAKVLQSWRTSAKEMHFRFRPKDPAAAKKTLESIVGQWQENFGKKATLPWQGRGKGPW